MCREKKDLLYNVDSKYRSKVLSIRSTYQSAFWTVIGYIASREKGEELTDNMKSGACMPVSFLQKAHVNI